MVDGETGEGTGNVVLDSLTEQDRLALHSHFRKMTLGKGTVLIAQGDAVETVHFPVSADLSNALTFSDGRMVEATAVGRDGMSGLAAFLANAPMAWDVICQVPGVVLTMEADVLRRQAKASPALLDLLLRVTHDNQSQAAQTAACNTLHDATQRFARWLLATADRTGRTQFDLTQEQAATLMGVQRTTINGAAQALRDSGAISFSRGKLSIANRAALLDMACECYAAQSQRSADFGLTLPEPG